MWCAAVEREFKSDHGYPVEVARVRITDAGLTAIAPVGEERARTVSVGIVRAVATLLVPSAAPSPSPIPLGAGVQVRAANCRYANEDNGRRAVFAYEPRPDAAGEPTARSRG